MTINRGMGKVEQLVCYSNCEHRHWRLQSAVHQRLLIVSADIPVNDSGKQGKIKIVSVLTNTSSLICHCNKMNWLKEFLMGTVEIAV